MAELETIFDSWDKESGDGRDTDETYRLADEYVSENSATFERFGQMSLEECVKALEVFRDAGMEAEAQTVQVWLWHHFEPQNIGGVYQPVVRNLNNG